jgi:hypothetical protein
MYVQKLNQGHLDLARLDLALAAILFYSLDWTWL